MKAYTHDHQTRDKHSNKPNHKLFAPHRQFQLLYRSCDKLPSSEQYQSVFFMKHKKISPEKGQNQKKKCVKKKEASKKKTQKEREVKGNPSENFASKNCKEDRFAATKTTIPTSTGEKFTKNSFAETFRKNIDLTKSSIKKIKSSSPSSSSRYLTAKGVSTKKDKIISTTNERTPKGQNLQRLKSPKRLNSPKTKKILEKSFPISKRNKDFSELEDQYILIEGKFLSAETPDCELLQEKLKVQAEEEKNQFVFSYKNINDYCPISKTREQFKEKVQYLQQPEKQKQEFPLEIIVKIQRWWKKVLKKLKGEENLEPEFQRSQNKSQVIEPSIELFMAEKQNTVVSYMKHKKNLLNKLLSLQKITKKEYSQIMSEIQESFHSEMREIIKLRELFMNQVLNIKHMRDEMSQEEKNAFLNIENLSVDEIVGKFTSKKNDEECQQFEVLTPSVLNSSLVRKKSTGCHISQDENSEQLEGKENSPNVSEQEISPLGKRQFFSEEKSDDEDEQGAMEASGQFKQLFEIYQDRQQAQLEIQKRHGFQLGMTIQEEKQYGISTSVVSIHKFLSNFLQFYLYFFKEQFLKMINMPYGYSQKSRLKILSGIHPQNVERYSILDDEEVVYGVQTVLGSEVLDDYHEHQYQAELANNDTAKAMIMFEQIHNRAIFDCFNEELNAFRPYFYINGPPYTWNYSQRALTFYYIAEENIQQVFEKTQYKVLKNSSSLCGAIVQPLGNIPHIDSQMTLEQKLSKYRQSTNPVLMENRQEKLAKTQKQQICDTNYRWEDVQELRTGLLLEIGASIAEMLLLEAAEEIKGI